ncbi:MAG: flagellar biosynthetic protein FliR [Planctomycetota bacterium]|nr:flagellar biosynthetic protein FliR [Planctomycetota bacterium]
MTALIELLPGFALVLSRLTGLFVFAPLLSSSVVPRQFKILLALAMALALEPVVRASGALQIQVDLYRLAPMMAAELLIGLSIGLLATIPLMTAQLAGLVMGQQMGLGLAAVYNPTIDFEGDNVGQILFFAALASFLAAGGLEITYDTLVRTFQNVPPGAFSLGRTPLEVLVGAVSSGFAVALRMAMPVLVILTLETLAMGFIMKSAPSLNIMNLGFPLRILLGVVMIISSLTIMLEALMRDIGADLDAMRLWALSL